jgi:hypothetical protein
LLKSSRCDRLQKPSLHFSADASGDTATAWQKKSHGKPEVVARKLKNNKTNPVGEVYPQRARNVFLCLLMDF